MKTIDEPKKATVTVCLADYAQSSWSYLLASVVFYALMPVIMPGMIVLSKLLKRPVKFWETTL